MAEKLFKVEIVTPKKVVFSSDVQSFTAPGTNGSFQVLVNHAPFLSSIGIGEVKLTDAGGNNWRYATSGGFVEVKNNHVVMLAESAERSDEIDVARAEQAKQRAVERLERHDPTTDIDRARLALLRALNRLRVAQKG
jgi:F-type H+-transporting ATPase subunit epsilon